MNIQDLGDELLGLEYCLKEILDRLIKDYPKVKDSELSGFDVNLIDIVAKDFIDNCFLKTIKTRINLNFRKKMQLW